MPDSRGGPMIVYNAFVCPHCLEGDTTSLMDGDASLIWCACGRVWAAEGDRDLRLVHEFNKPEGV